MDQKVIDRAVNIATRAALNDHPIKRAVWIPTQKATDNPAGCFGIEYAGPLKATETPSWDKG